MDDLPLGTNLMVACISYTGYDMEDACIINKMGKERGLMYGTIYKTKVIDMGDIEHHKKSIGCQLGCRDPDDPNEGTFFLFFSFKIFVLVAQYRKKARTLDMDGLPFAGSRIRNGDPIYCYYDMEKEAYIGDFC